MTFGPGAGSPYLARSEPIRIAIIGAGPAGSAAAIALRSLLPSAEAVLIDKAVFPREKICGDGLGPGARRTLDDLGLSDEIAHFNRPISVALTGPDDLEVTATGPFICGRDFSGYVGTRMEFDAILLEAASRRGAIIWEGQKFRGMSREPDGRITVELQSSSTHHKRRETFDFVIGADGAYSVVRQALDIDRPGKSRTIIAMRAYCTVGHPHKPLSETLRLDFIDALLPLYGWVFPMVGGRANIGIGIPVSILQKRGLNLRDLMTIYTDDLRRRGFEVSELEAVSVRQLPLASANQAMTARGWPAALIGDAAALINPLSGEGIFYGMAAGIQLAESIAAARGSTTGSTPDLARTARDFEVAFRRRFKQHYRNCNTAHYLMRSRLWARIVFRAAAKDPEILSLGALMMFDEQSIPAHKFVTTAMRGLF